MLPDLERHVVTSRIMTPLDFRDRLSAPFGAAFGLAPELTQSAWFRPHNRSEEHRGALPRRRRDPSGRRRTRRAFFRPRS